MVPPRYWLRFTLAIVFTGTSTATAGCQTDSAKANPGDSASAVATYTPAPARRITDEEQLRILMSSAKTAWNYVRRNASGSSGLVRSLDTWQYVTIWDIASALAAYHSARGLGFIEEADYRQRVDRALRTLETMPLYESVTFNKLYASQGGRMVDRNQAVSARGHGWSAVDLGRFLIWMKILAANDSVAAPAVERIVGRLDFKRMVKDGYLVGANTDLKYNNHYEYQEGRLGYEQYAAEGYRAWGAVADKALDFAANAKPIDVMGQKILADTRGDDLLTSEPFVMMGLELGWTSAAWEELARNVLAAQEARFKRTGTMTMLSEDAVPIKPAHFYYYLLHSNGKQFVVRAPGGQQSASYPRWVSTKAAFGWHALLPSDYTWSAVRAVLPSGASGRGWSAGVFERSRRATPGYNLNTAALVLEAAYFAHRGCPLIRPACN
jgi:hypothetical protein